MQFLFIYPFFLLIQCFFSSNLDHTIDKLAEMTRFLLPFSKRCLVLPNFSILVTQRCTHKMTVVPSLHKKRPADIITTIKRSAISWPNFLKKSQFRYELELGGALLYESIADRIDYKKFFQQFEMEDTFFSWFLVTEMHVWMLSVRIMQEVENGPKLRNYLIEAMWKDVKVRAKILGIANSQVMRSQLELLSEQFNASLVGYDEAILSSDALLANHIWKRFFKCKNNNPVQLEQLVEYTRKQVNFLSNTPSTDIFSTSPSIQWVNI